PVRSPGHARKSRHVSRKIREFCSFLEALLPPGLSTLGILGVRYPNRFAIPHSGVVTRGRADRQVPHKGDGMERQSVRIAMLAGTVAAVVAAAPAARADQVASPGCCSPGTRTICVTECVPETYQCKRISYRYEQRVEKYTCYKCVPYQECRERTVCCNRVVTEWVDQCRKVCVQVPVCEERTVMRPCYRYVTETRYVTRCVDRGHWECRDEYSHCKALSNCLSGLCGRGCGGGCCNPCDPCGNTCCAPCPPSNCVVRKVWCPCIVQEQCPVTCCRKVCEMRPEVIKVQCCRTEYRDQV